MNALNLLRYAMNRMDNEQAGQVLEQAGVQFRVGQTWASLKDGQLVNDSGDQVPTSAQVTGVKIGEKTMTPGSIAATGPGLGAPQEGQPGSAGYQPVELTDSSRRLVDLGTGAARQVQVDRDGNSQTILEQAGAAPVGGSILTPNSSGLNQGLTEGGGNDATGTDAPDAGAGDQADSVSGT
jgi:hypothetical protein